jgi:hypothetical protein
MSAERISARALRGAARLPEPDQLAQAGSTAGEQIDAEHLEDLEAQMDSLRVVIELESRADYGDPPSGDQRNHASFLAHFTELGSALEEWDSAVERAQVAPGSVWAWFAQATTERGFTEPPFAIGPLIDRLATLTVERARQGRLHASHRLYLQHFERASTRGLQASVYVEGQSVAQLPAEWSAPLERQIEAAGQRVQALFDDAQSCEAAVEIASSRDALLELKQPLLDRLALLASVEAFAFTESCPICESRARLAASARRRAAQDPGIDSVPGPTPALDVDGLLAQAFL